MYQNASNKLKVMKICALKISEIRYLNFFYVKHKLGVLLETGPLFINASMSHFSFFFLFIQNVQKCQTHEGLWEAAQMGPSPTLPAVSHLFTQEAAKAVSMIYTLMKPVTVKWSLYSHN